jgi:hypothetical protein
MRQTHDVDIAVRFDKRRMSHGFRLSGQVGDYLLYLAVCYIPLGVPRSTIIIFQSIRSCVSCVGVFFKPLNFRHDILSVGFHA